MLRFCIWTIFLTCFFFAQPGKATLFKNAYIAFELPDSWKCNLDQLEWLCRSAATADSKQAVIIITAKEVGPGDAFSFYESHLNSPITPAVKQGAAAASKIIYKTKNVKINDLPWIDGLHIGSEYPDYYTRYLITIKEKLAILVTFTSHKSHYSKFSQDFFRSVASLRIIAASNFLEKPNGGFAHGPGEGLFGTNPNGKGGFNMESLAPNGISGAGGSSDKKINLFIGILLVLIGLTLAYLKIKKK